MNLENTWFVLLLWETYTVNVSLACDANSFQVDNLLTYGKALENAAFWSGKMEEITDCAVGCMRRKMCQSFNYDMLSKWCELNYDIPGQASFREGTKSLVFSSIAQWPPGIDPSCSSRPCTVNQVCMPASVSPPSATQCSYICIGLTIYRSTCRGPKECALIGGTCIDGLCLCPVGVYDVTKKQCVAVCVDDVTMYANAIVEQGPMDERSFTCDYKYVKTVSKLVCRVDPDSETSYWYPTSGICVDLHGSSCLVNTECADIDGVCTADGTCQCVANKYYDETDQMCRLRFRLEAGSGGGNGFNTGLLQTYHDNAWRYVSFENWNWKGTLIVCQDINPSFVHGGSFHEAPMYGEGTTSTTMKFKDLNCDSVGDGSSLLACSYELVPKSTHETDIGITCYTENIQDHIRLNPDFTKNGPNSQHRLEVKFNGVWGTVCASHFGATNDADVACKSIDPSKPIQGSICRTSCAGGPNGPFMLHDIRCTGDETHFFFCKNGGWQNLDCPNEEVGLLCTSEGS